MRRFLLGLVMAFVTAPVMGKPQWMTLPLTPVLPASESSGLAPVNGVSIWYAVFGRGEPVILLHGGLANSNYWGHQVAALQGRYRVIVMDSRGHGRSTRNDVPFGYDLMAVDVLGLMDFLQVGKAAIVGWSDGAIIGLDIAMKHPERVTRLFAFAANSDPSGVSDGVSSWVSRAFFVRAEGEYRALSPTPVGYRALRSGVGRMWASQPNWTADDLRSITVPTWIVGADHDEVIRRANTEFMAAHIPRAGLRILPEVGHFAMLQDPAQFSADVLHFLAHVERR
jgi:pimeloyl-ACP methyl ester carboxylesterase